MGQSSNTHQGKAGPFAARTGLIDNELSRVKQLLIGQLESYSGSCFVNEILGHFKAISGKMLRPRLVLLSGSVCGGINEKHIIVAAILELIHSATLLHDDVIDEGEKRRGLATVNKLCGNESAVLLGDLLLSCAFRMCSDIEPEIIRIIADTTSKVCQGEIRQTQQRENRRLTEDEYIEIIKEKSAVFFSNCCMIGAKLAGADDAVIQALAEFGLNLGTAFQMTDDLLDIVGDENHAGKTLGTDANKNKLTLAVIHLLSNLPEDEKDPFCEKMLSAAWDRKKLSNILESKGSMEYCRGKVRLFTEKAISALESLPPGPGKDSLIEIAEYINSRV
ncbi:MAG: polyprenyl synthetase family protein [Candidatus Brocadiia bacterium]|nr:MAG: polyprenyl synthetase family protein [Candidatus Brocadiia bacterium]